MTADPKQNIEQKEVLHPRNLHRGNYNFKQLYKSNARLKAFVKLNQYDVESIDFSNPDAVIALNKALLKHFYRIDYWEIPVGYLCPPIPGRADYIHYMADLLAESNNGTVPKGSQIKVWDVGTGANCVYPVIGAVSYKWQFLGTDIDPVAIESANKIISLNPAIEKLVEIRQQKNKSAIFTGILKPKEVFDLTICNPPFHSSLKEAQVGTFTKWTNLGGKQTQKTLLNFGGQGTELWTAGGEAGFINRMVEQSVLIADRCFWFTTLVSKKDTLPGIYRALKKANALEVKTITMKQGQKVSRVVAWTFLTEAQQTDWRNNRWNDNKPKV